MATTRVCDLSCHTWAAAITPMPSYIPPFPESEGSFGHKPCWSPSSFKLSSGFWTRLSPGCSQPLPVPRSSSPLILLLHPSNTQCFFLPQAWPLLFPLPGMLFSQICVWASCSPVSSQLLHSFLREASLTIHPTVTARCHQPPLPDSFTSNLPTLSYLCNCLFISHLFLLKYMFHRGRDYLYIVLCYFFIA